MTSDFILSLKDLENIAESLEGEKKGLVERYIKLAKSGARSFKIEDAISNIDDADLSELSEDIEMLEKINECVRKVSKETAKQLLNAWRDFHSKIRSAINFSSSFGFITSGMIEDLKKHVKENIFGDQVGLRGAQQGDVPVPNLTWLTYSRDFEELVNSYTQAFIEKYMKCQDIERDLGMLLFQIIEEEDVSKVIMIAKSNMKRILDLGMSIASKPELVY